ncbi:hypothetical protein RHGRI_016996 [Rhododendron griersonianum]|uniref:Uncharacterized protein n=1 Tax=Rhododendron griersonianum TaxID=479676 RepID=A0AAV6JWA1_9ERIC|nr:hypothetical protein RHGRI_016996 [Rhododendron griersonianum]
MSLCSSNYTSAIRNRKYRIGSIVSIVRIKTWYFTDVVFRMTDIFDAVLVYSLNCCQTFILYGDVLVKTDMIFLYMIFSPLIPIVYQKAKRSYEKDISAFKGARVSNDNAFVRQEDDQGTVNAEEAGTLDVGVILRQHPESLLGRHSAFTF